ncbi:diguanylate cyclase [Oleidesulfovibrio sp.]|uniref:GGDEF domain-containing protein n=1 Tax=Oleidesulfovibrio sp. TaxID=2909707 RepID=UPI003A868A0E
MNHKNPLMMWGIKLESEVAVFLESVACNGCAMHNWDDQLPDNLSLDAEEPALVWISQQGWEEISALPDADVQFLHLIPRVLLLEEDVSPEYVQAALDAGFTDILNAPLIESRVREVFLRAAEMQTLYNDIIRMTREICLEREMLARKNDILEFIVTFLSRAAESLDPVEILNNAREDLGMLLPLKGLHAALWLPQQADSIEAELFLGVNEHSPEGFEWSQMLLKAAAKLSGSPVAGYKVELLGDGPATDAPEPGKVILLPLKMRTETVGCIALLTQDDCNLGKDQVQVLHSAMRHLALAVKNALLFSEMRTQADHDGLTQLHNRRHFDSKLRDELDRHGRYRLPLTLMMLDIDYFKQINDRYGHQVGDAILRELSSLLRDTIRSTDYCARYGGEEFVAILPHTEEKQARVLAERLRKAIEARTFRHHGQAIKVTISIGLTGVRPGALNSRDDLVKEADSALYLAKANGRNVVCSFTNGCSEKIKHAQ